MDEKNRQEEKFDVGVIGWWYSGNYGSVLTYYALHQLLTSLGLSVLMIERPGREDNDNYVIVPDSIPRRFAGKRYHISRTYHFNELGMLNDICKTFISGSDQLFNYYLRNISGPPFYLDFVAPYNNIISYASSFGNDYYGDEKTLLQSAYLLKRFKALSFRETYAVEICKNKFGIDAVCVLDPVFMVDRSEYDKLGDEADLQIQGDYIAAFILDPDDEKRQLLQQISAKMGMPVHCLIDAVKIQENTEKLNLPNIHGDADVEEWIAVMRNAKFVITDSFHGTCFAIIFRRQFISLANHRRGARRFGSLLEQFSLSDRLVRNISEVYAKDDLYVPIEYDKVFEMIDARRQESLDWLKHAIFDPIEIDAEKNEFQLINYQLTELYLQMQEMKRKLEKDRVQKTERGIRAMVLDHLEENVPKEKSIQKLQRFFDLTKEEAEKFRQQFEQPIK